VLVFAWAEHLRLHPLLYRSRLPNQSLWRPPALSHLVGKIISHQFRATPALCPLGSSKRPQGAAPPFLSPAHNHVRKAQTLRAGYLRPQATLANQLTCGGRLYCGLFRCGPSHQFGLHLQLSHRKRAQRRALLRRGWKKVATSRLPAPHFTLLQSKQAATVRT
jgi:hypothetical protein